MKVYTIGREEGCDIVINDNTDVISRRHAVINVSPSGKMTIVDYSHNGTYVNGIRIAQNVPVPVTRKDNISFSHVARLDWSQIPNTRAIIIRYGVLGLLAVLLIIGGICGYNACSNTTETPDPQPSTVVVDSTEQVQEDKDAKEREELAQDSIAKKHAEDSLEAAKQKQVPEKKKASTPKGNSVKKDSPKKEEPKKEEPKKEEPKKRFR